MKRTALLTTITLALAGCSATHQNAPEPTSANIVNGTSVQVIQMPDGFRNVAVSCYGTVGVYVTSRGSDGATPQASGVAVLANDPHCAK